MGGHRRGRDGCTAAANAAVIVILVLSSWGGIGFESDGRTAAANAAVIVVLVPSSWGDIGLMAMIVLLLICGSDRRAGALLGGSIGLVAMVHAAADAVVIVVLVLSCSEHWHDGECITSA